MSEKLKPGWTSVAFGNLVERVKETGIPTEKESRTYIGLEHLDPGSFKVSRWGSHVALVVPKTRVKKGDVLFARRNTHLKRCALAPFDCYFSPDGYALRSKSPLLLQDLLLYFVASDSFMNYAIEHSAGTHSKRVKWEDIVRYEFALPPLEEQLRIVQLISAVRDMVECNVSLANASSTLRSAIEDELIVGGNGRASDCSNSIETIQLPVGWTLVRASSLCSAPITSGITPKNGEQEPDIDCPFIKVGNLRFDGELDYGPGDSRLNRSSFETTQSLHVVAGDILTNIVGPPLGKVSVVPNSMHQALINQAIVRYRPNNTIIGKWLCAYLMSSWAKQWLFDRSKKTSGQRNINATTCAALPVPLPPDSQMLALVRNLDAVISVERSMARRIRDVKLLMSAVIKESVMQ